MVVLETKKITMEKDGEAFCIEKYKKKSTINQNNNTCIEHFGDNNTPIRHFLYNYGNTITNMHTHTQDHFWFSIQYTTYQK